MIPKILHQVWLGPNTIPREFLDWRGGWRSLHPDWTYMLHTNEDVPQHLKHYIESCKHFSPEMHKFFMAEMGSEADILEFFKLVEDQ